MKKYIYIFQLSFIFLTFVSLTHASPLSLKTSPAYTEITAKPGSSPQVIFTVENKGDPMIVNLDIKGIQPIDTYGHVKITDVNGPLSFNIYNSSLKLNSPLFLKSDQKISVPLQINISDGAPEKDYLLSLLTTSGTSPAEEGKTNIQIQGAVGSQIILHITSSGNFNIKPSIPILTTPSLLPFKLNILQIFDTLQSIPLILIVSNTGTHSFHLEGEIAISGWNIHKTYPLQPTIVLASSQRLIHTKQQIGCANCNENLSSEFKALFIGKYTVTSTLKVPNSSLSITKSTSFLAVPFVLIGMLLIICYFGVFIFKKLHIKHTNE